MEVFKKKMLGSGVTTLIISNDEMNDIFKKFKKISKTTNGKAMILSTCAICSSKKSKFIKEQEAKGLLSNLGLRTPLNKIPVLGDILF